MVIMVIMDGLNRILLNVFAIAAAVFKLFP